MLVGALMSANKVLERTLWLVDSIPLSCILFMGYTLETVASIQLSRLLLLCTLLDKLVSLLLIYSHCLCWSLLMLQGGLLQNCLLCTPVFILLNPYWMLSLCTMPIWPLTLNVTSIYSSPYTCQEDHVWYFVISCRILSTYVDTVSMLLVANC